MDKVNGAVVASICVLLVAIVAGLNDELGKVLAVVMGGFLLLWAMTSGANNDLTKWIGQMGSSGSSEPATTVSNGRTLINQ